MRAPSISPHRFRRQLIVTLALFGLVSAAVLMPGVVGAALKSSHPAIPLAGETLGYYAQGGSGDLLPNNQSVLPNPKADLIFEDVNSFWEQTFSDSQVNYGQTLTNMQVVEQYFTDVSGSAFEGLLSQYSGISNTITSKAVVLSMNSTLHSDQCGTNTISDSGTDGSGIAPDIWNAVSTQAPIDSSTIYFVFTPPGFHVYGPNDSCSQDNCGYHNDFLLGEGIYAVIPFGGGHCGTQTPFSDQNGVQIDINTASHEQFEAITDPGAGQFGTSAGWYDQSGLGGEIGDKCGNQHPGVYLNGHFYDDVQGEYDNASTAVDPTGQPLKCAYTVQPPPPTPTPTNTPVPTCSVTNEADNIQPSNGTNPYVDNRGNTWYVYYDIKRDAKTNAPCQMQLVVRIFNPAPNGAWSGTASLYTLVNGNYDSASFGKVSGSCTYQYHFVWRGPWFKAGSAYYHLETFEYNGSNAYTRAWANFSI